MFLYIKTNILRGSPYLNVDFTLPEANRACSHNPVVIASLSAYLIPSRLPDIALPRGKVRHLIPENTFCFLGSNRQKNP